MAFIKNTDVLIEGSSNLFFSAARAKQAVVDNSIGSATDKAPSQKAVQDALDLKLNSSLKGSANGLAELDGSGKIPSSQIPALALVDVHVVANNAARDALSVQEGDVAIVQDTGKSWIYDGSAWQELTAAGYVTSVNGQTGSVLLGTDQVAEGSSNLYHTQARARQAAVVNSSSGTETDQAMSVSAAKSYVGAQIDLLSTSDIEEGSRLYYTQARFDSAFSAKSTSNLSEGSNLYYTQARFDSALGAKSTSDLAEGSNQYHTTARARQAAVVNSSAGNESDQAMSVSAAKSYISGEISSAITGYALESFVNNAINALDTDDIEEGSSNLYYTQARFDSALSAKSTSNLAEGSNLYHTDARARSAAVVNSSSGSETDQAMSVSAAKSHVQGKVESYAGGVMSISSSVSIDFGGAHAGLRVAKVSVSGGSVTLTLPSATSNSGRFFKVKDDGSSSAGGNFITVSAQSGQQVDGAGSFEMKMPYESAEFFCDGSKWLIM